MHSLRDATSAVRSALRRTLAELDLTPVQNTALRIVAAEPGSSPAELSRHMHVTPQTMHKLVTDLEHRGLLALQPRPGHGRILDTHLTDDGERLLAEADTRTQAIEDQLTAGLSQRQRQQLLNLLDHCVAALDPPQGDEQQHQDQRPSRTR